MREDAHSPIKLRRNEVVSPNADFGIEVVSGCVWMTHLDSPQDVILECGDVATVSAAKSCVLFALAESEIWLRGAAGNAGLLRKG